MNIVWSSEMEEVMRDAYPYCRLDELADAFGIPESAVKKKASYMKLQKAPGYRGVTNYKWTQEEDQFIRDNYDILTEVELAGALNKTPSAAAQRRYKLGLHPSTNRGCIKKGNVSRNKGKKQTDYMSPEAIERTRATRFKKGIPPNTLYDYAVRARIHSRGLSYLFIRLSPGKWQLFHRWLWVQHYGPIPKNAIISFKDGNTANVDINNLEMINRQINMERNHISFLRSASPEVYSALMANVALKRTITQLIKKQS